MSIEESHQPEPITGAGSTAPQDPSPATKKKAPPGASWKNDEAHVLPKNRLGIVFAGLMCTVFLAAIDQTIVATALPTIVSELGGGKDYSWVGTAYLLAAASLAPLYGKLSDLIGRKPILYTAIVIFLVLLNAPSTESSIADSIACVLYLGRVRTVRCSTKYSTFLLLLCILRCYRYSMQNTDMAHHRKSCSRHRWRWNHSVDQHHH
jgi:hypothetical protein